MGISCKPVGKDKSIMKKVENKTEREAHIAFLAKQGKRKSKKNQEFNYAEV